MANRVTGTKTTTKTTKPRPSARARSETTRDAIALLKADHREVERLFAEFEKAGDTAYKSKRRLVDQMVVHLSQHAAIEEEVLYPTGSR